MTLYLLDTNIVSHILRGDPPQVRARLVTVPMRALAVSVVTQAELAYGLAKRGNPAGLAAKVREFLLRVAVLPWTPREAQAYGELRARCEADGTCLAPLDMLIAAQAHALQEAARRKGDSAVLVTRDRAFGRISVGLTIEDWTA